MESSWLGKIGYEIIYQVNRVQFLVFITVIFNSLNITWYKNCWINLNIKKVYYLAYKLALTFSIRHWIACNKKFNPQIVQRYFLDCLFIIITIIMVIIPCALLIVMYVVWVFVWCVATADIFVLYYIINYNLIQPLNNVPYISFFFPPFFLFQIMK